MKPTDEQIEYMENKIYFATLGAKETIRNIIAHWESIRPPCPNCTNPPGVRDMIQKAQIRQLWDNLEKAQAALPEWIPVTEDLGARSVIALNPITGTVANCSMLRPGQSHSYYIEHETLAALPKRQIPVKVEPTAEDVERAEFEEWAKGEDLTMEVGSDTLYYHVVTRAAFAGWKAARAGR